MECSAKMLNVRSKKDTTEKMYFYKIAVKILFAAIFSHSLFAVEIRILYRRSLSPILLNSISQDYYGVSKYRNLSAYEKKRLEFLIDPTGVGHVALEIPSTENQNKILGWQPITDIRGAPLDFEDLASLETLLAQLQTSNFKDSQYIYPSVSGKFVDNTKWANGAILDPVYEIPLSITQDQFNKLREGIEVFNFPNRSRFQLMANTAAKSLTKEFPHFHFNCLMAVKELFVYAAIKTNFSFGEGFLCKFVENVTLFSRKRTNRLWCPTTITAPNLATQLPHF